MSEKKSYSMYTSQKRQNPVLVEGFESDNVYKDIAQKMGEYMRKHPTFAGTILLKRDSDGAEDKWYISRTGTGAFITYPRGYDSDLLDDFIAPEEARYLVCLDEATNEYKSYTLSVEQRHGEPVCIADYGRLGVAKGATSIAGYDASKDGSYEYPVSMFWPKYYEKIEAKGYVDRTEQKDFDHKKLFVFRDSDHAPLPDKDIDFFISMLISAQKKSVEQNYNLEVPSSQAAIDHAKEVLQQMIDLSYRDDYSTGDMNKLYRDLVLTIPRRIDDVAAYLGRWDRKPDSDNYIGKVLDNEAELLMNFVDVFNRSHGKEGELEKTVKKTALEANGVTADYVPYRKRFELEDLLDGHQGSRGSRDDLRHYISSIIAVNNPKTEAALQKTIKERNYDPDKDVHLLFHGSQTQNWWSIFTTGLQVHYSADGMFGRGLYFAPLAQKSRGYTSMHDACWRGGQSNYGVLALFDVAMGKPHYTTDTISALHGDRSNPMNYLRRNKCDSIWAKEGRSLYNDECIVYEDGKATIRYLILLDGDRHTMKNLTYKDARKLEAFCPVYNEETKEIVAAANLSEVIPGCKESYLYYNTKTNQLRIPNWDEKLYGNEKQYLLDVFASNFADNPREFKAWVQDVILDHEESKSFQRQEEEPER